LRSRYLVVALVGVLTLGGALTAWAVTPAESTLNVFFTPGTKSGGTTKKPQRQTLNINFRGGTTTGMGQPATAVSLNTVLPTTWRINGERWPKGKRCDIAKANQQKSIKACPAGSKIGEGVSIAKGADGGVVQTLDIDAYVIKNGDLGFFLNSRPEGEVVAIDQMIQGQTFGGNKLNVKIPENLQEPLDGVEVGITKLTTKFTGKTRVKGKTIGIFESRGCPSSKRWRFTETFVYRGRATNKDSDTAPCRR